MATEADIDAALDAVIRAARHHRAVLKSSVATDEEIWVAYTTLNNASVHYDDLVNQTYDEVTPWDCEYIDPDGAAQVAPPTLGRSGVASHTVMAPLLTDEDLTGMVAQTAASRRAGVLPIEQHAGASQAETLICVRQRRDYVIGDPDAVMRAARDAQMRAGINGGSLSNVRGLGEAIYALIDAGDGTLAALDDVNEIDPANGVILVNQTNTPVLLNADPELAFALAADDKLLYRLDEVMSEET